MEPGLVRHLQAEMWWDLKRRLKSGSATLTAAIADPIGSSKPLIQLVALARLGAGEHHDSACATAAAALDAAGIPDTTIGAEVHPARLTALLRHLQTRCPEPAPAR